MRRRHARCHTFRDVQRLLPGPLWVDYVDSAMMTTGWRWDEIMDAHAAAHDGAAQAIIHEAGPTIKVHAVVDAGGGDLVTCLRAPV